VQPPPCASSGTSWSPATMTGEELARLRAAVEALTADVATAPVRQNAFANWVALLFDGDAPAHADHPPGEGLMTDSFVSGRRTRWHGRRRAPRG